MDLLEGVLKKILAKNQTLKQGLQDARLLEAWPVAVGDQLAKHSRAVQVKGRTLFIEVDHPIWKQELHSNKHLALMKLNTTLDEWMGKKSSAADGRWIEDLFLLSTNTTQTKAKLKRK